MMNHNNDPDVQRKRKRPAEGKSRKKGPCITVCIGESSASQPPEPEREKDPIEEAIENDVPKAIKMFRDRLRRRIYNRPDMKSFMDLTTRAGVDLNLIQSRWPVLSDLRNIKNEIDEISQKIQGSKGTDMEMEVTEEMKKRLRGILEKLKKSDEHRQEDIKKVDNLVKDFIEGTSLETLKEKFFTAFPWLTEGEIETNGPIADQDQGSSLSREQLIDILFAPENNEVHVEDFHGLKEAIEKTTGMYNVPRYLKSIAKEIEKDRGTATELVDIDILILVCAAIDEMKYMPISDLNWTTLLKWRTVLNKAAQAGFHVKIAEILLFKNLYALFAYLKI